MTTELDVIDHEDVALVVRDTTLFRSDDPGEVADRAIATADALMKVVNQRRRELIAVISGKDYPQVECWTLLGTLLGVFPVCEWTRPVMEDGKQIGWEARVSAQTRDGSIVGSAESMCTRHENSWKARDDFALRGMAETRATSRAMRKPLGFVMKLAGLEATAAEEMDGVAADSTATATEPRSQFVQPASVPPAAPEPPPSGAPEFRFASGAHQGKTLGEVPPSYLEWYLAKGPRQDVKDAIAAYTSGGVASEVAEAFPDGYDESIPF